METSHHYWIKKQITLVNCENLWNCYRYLKIQKQLTHYRMNRITSLHPFVELEDYFQALLLFSCLSNNIYFFGVRGEKRIVHVLFLPRAPVLTYQSKSLPASFWTAISCRRTATRAESRSQRWPRVWRQHYITLGNSLMSLLRSLRHPSNFNQPDDGETFILETTSSAKSSFPFFWSSTFGERMQQEKTFSQKMFGSIMPGSVQTFAQRFSQHFLEPGHILSTLQSLLHPPT